MVRKSYRICLIRGDGIGPEIIDATLHVLDSVSKKFKLSLNYVEVPGGDSALKKLGDPLPQKSVDEFAQSDACLKGPVGETVMDINAKLRFGFDLYANVRPAKSCQGICPPALRPDIDLTVIRENSEGFYKALENEIVPGTWTTSGVFTRKGAERIANFSFDYAKLRRKKSHVRPKVTLATKANIFRKTHGMYLESFQIIAKRNPEVDFEHLYADALCALLVRNPARFDVIVSENLIADLLSDLTGQIAGGLGMTPGTNINYETKHAYFEPTHGCANDIVGKGITNPIGQIRSAELMLQYLAIAYNDERMSEAANAINSTIEIFLNSSDKSTLPFEVGGRATAQDVADSIVEKF